MADSPRRQMQKVLESKTMGRERKEGAQYILEHEEWLPIIKGHQAYFRDFILRIVHQCIRLKIDDSKLPGILSDLVETKYLWEVFNQLKHPDIIADAVVVAATSIERAGFDTTGENFVAVFKIVIEPSIKYTEPLVSRGQFLHPLIVEQVITDPTVAERLLILSEAGISDPLLALSMLDEELVAPLVAGAL